MNIKEKRTGETVKRQGICSKCGKETTVRDHHIKGYGEENKDEVVPYCYSCDQKAHDKARREGRCTLPSKETNRLSANSCNRRSKKNKTISYETLMPNVRLFEQVRVNLNTGHINVVSYFTAHNGKKLKYIDIE